MHSPLSATIDAGVLAVPDVGCDIDDAFQYVDTLIDWSELLRKPWIAILMSKRAVDILVTNEIYPFREKLQALFDAHGIREYDVNTVDTIVARLLTRTPFFETYYQVEDVLCDRPEIDPDIIHLTTHDSLQSDLVRCVTLIAILRKHCSLPLGGHLLILREAPKQVIQVRAQIHDVEHTRKDIPPLPCPPEFFEGDILVCDDFRGLIECLDEVTILIGASDDLGIELAIRIALFKHSLAQGKEPDWGNALIPSIGSKFRVSLQQCCVDQGDSLPPKILRSIVETISGQNLQAVHAIRRDSGGNSQQLLRGLDKAQRRDIDREFRLHYWECKNGTIELALVAYHHDFSIPK